MDKIDFQFTWAVVEVMGHKRFAGMVSEQSLGGASFVRIDVPDCTAGDEQLPPFTKLIGPGSIYAITPCTEETARAFAQQFRSRAFDVYEAPRLPAPESVVPSHRQRQNLYEHELEGDYEDDDEDSDLDPYDDLDERPDPHDVTNYLNDEGGDVS